MNESATLTGLSTEKDAILELLYRVIRERKLNPEEKSYTASLFRKGLD